MFRNWIIFSLLIGLSLQGCCQSKDLLIKDHKQFTKYASEPLYQKYGQVSAVKVIYDSKKEKLHIVPSYRFKYHYEYCMELLGYRGDLGEFNREAYSNEEEREFLLGNINYYEALDKYALEIGPSDRMTAKNIQLFYNKVKQQVFFGNDMLFMLNTTHVSEMKSELSSLKFLTPDEIYKNQTYQPLVKNTAKGRLVLINDWEKQQDEIRMTDILVMETIPEVFPPVSGIIVSTFQTPLSHVAILGQNRKIPVCAYKNAFETDWISKLDGKTVKFIVAQDTLSLVEKNYNLSNLIKTGPEIILKADLSIDTLIEIKHIGERSSHFVGNKAGNFGELVRYSKRLDFSTPESAFAIPFHFYNQHLSKSGSANSLIQDLLSKDNFSRNRSEIEAELLEIRELIENTEIDANLLADVESMIVRLGDQRRMRFRSSTNAEDKKGFSGAGLYTSKTGELGNEEKPIDKAIKKVWSSMWSYGAFMERETSNIQHTGAYMGILVHRSFPNEEVNGVAITTNLYRDSYLGFVVNAQVGDISVVNPPLGIECDQFICYPDKEEGSNDKKDGGIDIINYSNQNEGNLVMTIKEIQALANTLEDIKKMYSRTHYLGMDYYSFALDIEFKLDRETRKLYIKQMRIFNR